MNVSVGVRYVDAWLQGVGAAAIDNLMEDAATAEISRAQVWSWVQAGRFDEARVREEIAAVEAAAAAKEVFADVALTVPLKDFLTTRRTIGCREPREHQGRRHRGPDRGGDRLRRARARLGAAPGAALRAVRRLADAGARGAAAARGARARLVRAEQRGPRAHAVARRSARGVPRSRRARGARHGDRRARS